MRRHEIPFFAGRGDVRAFAEENGRTVEEAARQLRYKFLEETRRREGFGCILTAHHADDSAETMLLNLLRGTGLKGLTGIPEKRDCILRPLLGATRAELAAYAAAVMFPMWRIPPTLWTMRPGTCCAIRCSRF